MLPLQLRQFLPGSGVGFSADWVSRNQGGELNLGAVAAQAPWLSRHATGPSPAPVPLALRAFGLQRLHRATTLALVFL